MGRKRKYQFGDVATYAPEGSSVVVVDWRLDDSGHSQYRVIRKFGRGRGQLYGQAVWVETWLLQPTGERYKRAVSVYKKNGAIPGRGCSCNCCVHVAERLGEVRLDGTFADDDD